MKNILKNALKVNLLVARECVSEIRKKKVLKSKGMIHINREEKNDGEGQRQKKIKMLN